ncbi:MAG: MFS transporter [Chitinophagales bacterium]
MPIPGVFRHREYALLWLGQLVSNLGDAFQTLALAWLVKERSGSNLLIGTVLAAYLLPMVALGPVAGVIADQFNKRKLMIAADLFRMALVVILALLHDVGPLHAAVIVFLALLMGAATALFDPARQGSIPYLVPEAELGQANSFAMLTRQLSQLLGPVVAGVVIGRWGVGPAFWANAASFAVSAAFLSQMRFQSSIRVQRSLGGVWEDMKAGLQTITHHPLLRLILPSGMLVNFLLGPVPVMLPSYAGQLSRRGAMALGYLQSTSAVGMLIGSLLVGLTVKRLGKGYMAIGGLVVAGLGIVALSEATTLTAAGLALGLFGICMVFVNVPLITVIQSETPVELQGRIFSVFMSTTTAAQPLAMAVGGGLADMIGVRSIFLGVGILFILTSLGIASIRPLREVH